MRDSPALSILIITEDTGKGSYQTLQHILRRTFRLMESHCETQRIAFREQGAATRQTSRANLWKSNKHRQKLVALRREIATSLLETSPPGFVAFHFDGDQVWSRRDASENCAKFSEQIITPVCALVQKMRPDRDADEVLSHLLPIVPFYSIEAWLFQNTRSLKVILKTQHSGRDLNLIAKWEQDRGMLDELEKPKQAICAGAKHNEALAKTLPVEDVHRVGKSYHATVETMGKCAALAEALKPAWAR